MCVLCWCLLLFAFTAGSCLGTRVHVFLVWSAGLAGKCRPCMPREPRQHLADDECDVRCRTMPLKVRQRLAGADKWRAMAFGLPIRDPSLRPLPPGTGGPSSVWKRAILLCPPCNGIDGYHLLSRWFCHAKASPTPQGLSPQLSCIRCSLNLPRILPLSTPC